MENVVRRCKKYRDYNVEKETERHILYNFNNKEDINGKKRKYNDID